ncbi:Ig-like domain-containing protein [Heyndrickxia sp. FSL W8-0423]|uniref:Ig-like domain-containing protein n=1 Tax=Heyndrickxia sp. FSL W8-0423 TaxID=2921601 RepID=UPI0030F7ED21
MGKKTVLSLLSAGILAFSLSVSSVHAETKTNQFELTKKALNQQGQLLQKRSPYKLHTLEAYSKQIHAFKKLQSYKLPRISRTLNSYNSNDNSLFEQEPNDDFPSANKLPYDNLMVGQLLPLYDVDLYKVKVEKGTLLVAGLTNSYAIDLVFGALEKDFKDHGYLEYLGNDYDPSTGVLIHVYDVKKAGTYYIVALDGDDEYDIDDNSVEDLYGLMATYVDTVAPSRPIVNNVTNKSKTVTGKAEANSAVTVKSGKKVLGSSKASSKGEFSVKISAQKAGTKLTVSAKDKAGNVSAGASVTVKDAIPPAKPTVNKITNKSKVVTGKAEANVTVTVKNGSKVLGSAKASSKGSFSVKIKAQKAGSKLTISAKDKAGNVSAGASVTVKDVIPPAKPTVNRVTNKSKVVTGKAEANSTAMVKKGSKVLGSAKASSKGTFSVKIKAQKAGTKLTITAKDKAGNVSAKVVKKVVKY